MICSVRSLGLTGVSGYQVTAECFISNGLPAFEIVGLPDACCEGVQRAGPGGGEEQRISVPSEPDYRESGSCGHKKTGTLYDLPIFWDFWRRPSL